MPHSLSLLHTSNLNSMESNQDTAYIGVLIQDTEADRKRNILQTVHDFGIVMGSRIDLMFKALYIIAVNSTNKR